MFRSFREDKPFKVDKNGTQYFYDWTCRRCGGLGGSDAWAYTGWTCYECGGAGKAQKPDIIKVYTDEYRERLEAQRQKRHEKKVAELKAQTDEKNAEFFEKNAFDAQGFTYVALGNTYGIKEQLKAEGFKYNDILGWHTNKATEHKAVKVHVDDVFAKNEYGWYTFGYEKADAVKAMIKAESDKLAEAEDTTRYLGEVGQKIKVDVILQSAYSYSYNIGWQTVYSTAYTFRDADGNLIVWKTQKDLGLEEGQHVTIEGKVKEHSLYRNKKQTVITRAKVA